jgi:hypothetical protein
MFPSPATANGKVGLDADTAFAATGLASWCTTSPAGVPRHNRVFEISTGGGFGHKEPVTGAHTTPRADHSYRYLLTGQGATAKFSFRMVDDPLRDNYGVLRITISRQTAEDCKRDGWRQFGVFSNQGDCVSYVATNGRNLPAGA